MASIWPTHKRHGGPPQGIDPPPDLDPFALRVVVEKEAMRDVCRKGHGVGRFGRGAPPPYATGGMTRAPFNNSAPPGGEGGATPGDPSERPVH